MRDEPITDRSELLSFERQAGREPFTVEAELSLEVRRTVALLAIFVGLLILRFN